MITIIELLMYSRYYMYKLTDKTNKLINKCHVMSLTNFNCLYLTPVARQCLQHANVHQGEHHLQRENQELAPVTMDEFYHRTGRKTQMCACVRACNCAYVFLHLHACMFLLIRGSLVRSGF